MSYRINLTNGSLLTVVEEGTIDQSTDLKLVGRYFVGYGEIQNENFVSLLENFADESEPNNPLKGQIWYDSAESKIKFFDGEKWRSAGTTESSNEQPTGLSDGDFWFDRVEEQLYAFNGENYVLIGPEKVGPGITRIEPLTVKATDQESYSVIAGVISTQTGDQYVFVSSNDEFEIDHNTTNPLGQFGEIKKGFTLAGTRYTENGISEDGYIYWGTSAVAKGLLVDIDGEDTFVDANDFLINDPDKSAEFGNSITLPESGIQLGEAPSLIYVEDDNLIVENQASEKEIKFRLPVGNEIKNISSYNKTGLVPGEDLEYDIGTTSLRWRDVYAGKFHGVATSAQYADLAEKYTTDQHYPTGTIMSVSPSVQYDCHAAQDSETVVGVVSDKPAYVMNSESSGQAIGLKGRVPVRTVGPVNKGDNVYLFADGVGSTKKTSQLVGVALESNKKTGEKLVECVLKT